MRGLARTIVVAACLVGAASAATLPPHRELRVLIVSDEVNPHGLSDADLTQPGDLALALRKPGAALNLDPAPDGVLELPTNELATATRLLSVPPCDPAAYDVLVYFSHRIPDDGPDAQARQDAFVAAVDAFLASGGGVVSFHHGSYLSPGKDAMLALIGGRASGAVPWEPSVGQDVIAVAPSSFVASNGLTYDGVRTFADAASGVASGDYPVFNNAPDERYPSFTIDSSAETQARFESDYDGAPHVLGFEHRRAAWLGSVVAWQPGEYEPHSCNPADRTFQVFVNAIVQSTLAQSVEDAIIFVRREGGGVRIDWANAPGARCVFRSQDVRDVTLPQGAAGLTWLDATPPAGFVAYLVGER